MALFTSIQTGDWNNTTSWDIAGFPALGDTVIILTSHIITITANAGVGTGGATGTDELTIIGTLVVGDFTLTVDGDTQINDGTLQLNAGAEFSVDGTYEIEYTGVANFIANGISTNRCSIAAIASNNTWVDGVVSSAILNISADYCDFTRFGDGSNRSFDINGSTGTQTIIFQNCLFDTFTRWDMYQATPTSTNYQFKLLNCDFRNMGSSNFFIIGSGGTYNFDAGTHVIQECTFAGNSSGSIVLIRTGSGDNIFELVDNITENCEFRVATNFSMNRHFNRQDSGRQTAIYAQNPTIQAIIENVINWGDYTNIHLFASSGDAGAIFQDSISFSEEPSGFGNHYLPSEVDTDNNTIVRRCVGVGDNFAIMRGTGAATTECYQNTHISNDVNADDLFLIESPGYDGTFTSHSNIEYSLNPNDKRLFNDLVGAGLGVSSTIDYNCLYDHSLTERYWDTFNSANLLISGKTVGDVGFGASDITADPQFNNEFATIQTWDTSLGGPGTVSNAFDELIKINGIDRSGNPATYNPDYNTPDALTYFRDAFTPTNSALKGTGQGGVDIGALPVDSGALLTGAVSETLSLSDVNSKIATFSASVIESFGVADIGNNVAKFVATLTDNFTINEVIIGINKIQGSISESITITDSNSASAILVGILTDSLNLTDGTTSTLAGVISAAVLESLNITDADQASATKQGIILESLSVEDATIFGSFISAVIAESLSLGDSNSVQATFNVTVDESVNLVDIITNIAKLQSAIIEALNLTDVAIETSILPEGLLTISITTSSNSITFNVTT